MCVTYIRLVAAHRPRDFSDTDLRIWQQQQRRQVIGLKKKAAACAVGTIGAHFGSQLGLLKGVREWRPPQLRS